MVITVAILIALVQILQFTGMRFAAHFDKRKHTAA
jgi:ABC-type methionine transport system permease subunit